jgi:hypothetical protein
MDRTLGLLVITHAMSPDLHLLPDRSNFPFPPLRLRGDVMNGLKIEQTSWIKSPLAPLSQRGVIPPFDKGREGGIL